MGSSLWSGGSRGFRVRLGWTHGSRAQAPGFRRSSSIAEFQSQPSIMEDWSSLGSRVHWILSGLMGFSLWIRRLQGSPAFSGSLATNHRKLAPPNARILPLPTNFSLPISDSLSLFLSLSLSVSHLSLSRILSFCLSISWSLSLPVSLSSLSLGLCSGKKEEQRTERKKKKKGEEEENKNKRKRGSVLFNRK